MQSSKTIEHMLDEARLKIARLEPGEAQLAAAAGGLIVDIRSEKARERDGIIPGSLHIPRTVLEWRIDPRSSFRNPEVGGLDREVILLCDHGYSSSLAAAMLVELGFDRAGEVVGGFEAWVSAGLPVGRPRSDSPDGTLPGMGRPD